MTDNLTIRPVNKNDEEIMWQMLYYAAHMNEENSKTVDDAKTDSFLRRYVENWGKPDDLGLIAELDGSAVGAVWLRLFDGTIYPELATAVLPNALAKGIKTQLMTQIIAASKNRWEGIMLSVRSDNPAYHLYERMGFETVRELTNRVGTASHEMLLNL